jgi:DNA-binding transcriptional regulator YhcF (GntR family)/uncharacterized protein YqgV (UPF0045/DUF77 family)
MNVQLVVTPGNTIPIALQLKYQLSYLIASQAMPVGTKMPSVREVATDLGISPGTVMHAYRLLVQEGLLMTQGGRGTFVSPQAQGIEEDQLRTELLDAAVRELVSKAEMLGFSAGQLQQRLVSDLSHRPPRRPVGFISTRVSISTKYARLLEQHFAGQVEVRPIAYDPAHPDTRALAQAAEGIFFFVGPARLLRENEVRLRAAGVPFELIGMTTAITSETAERLRALPATTRACLVTEAQYVHSSLNIIFNASSLNQQHVQVAIVPDLSALKGGAEGFDVVFYTSPLGEQLDAITLPANKRFELGIDYSRESLAMLRDRLHLDAAS